MSKKKRKQRPKPRNINVILQLEETKDMNVSYTYDKNSRSIIMLDSRGAELPLHGVHTYYNGINKQKVESAIFHNRIPIDDAGVFADYDMVHSIDTNYKQIKDVILAVCIVISWQILPGIGCDPRQIIFQNYIDTDFGQHKTMKYENLMWAWLISNLHLSEDSKKKKHLIVVDSDLGSLDAYNKRTVPFYTDEFEPETNIVRTLPENYALCYARADSSAQKPLNFMIRCCDKISTNILRSIEKNFPVKYKDIPSKRLINQKSRFVKVFFQLCLFSANDTKQHQFTKSPFS